MQSRSPQGSRRGDRGAPPGDPSGALGSSKPLQGLVEAFELLPGIGRRTAERLAYHILRVPPDEALKLADAIREVKLNLRHCKACFNISEAELCSICQDETRDPATICVVEQPKDLYAIEASGSYRGLYHVLLGTFSPLEGVQPSDLTVDALIERIRGGNVSEVILATNPNFEGDGTALYLRDRLKGVPGLRLTRIARGMPSGSHIEHVAKTIVSDALEGRRDMVE